MGILFDIIPIALVLILAYTGYKKGFMYMIYSFASFFVSIIIAWLLYGRVSELLTLMGADQWLTASLFGDIQLLDTEELPSYLQSMVESGQLSLMDAMNTKLVDLILNVLSFVIVVILTWIIVQIIKKAIRLVSNTPIIGTVDRLSGGALGATEGILLILIVLSVIYACTSLLDNKAITDCIDNSYILKFLYENNPIIKMIEPTHFTF